MINEDDRVLNKDAFDENGINISNDGLQIFTSVVNDRIVLKNNAEVEGKNF